MAGASLFSLLDDIATLLDDIAVMSKVAAKKTAGVLGDDLALNAQQVSGVSADRELPVVWAVAKGSMLNKVILVPAALIISALMPALILPMLMLGGVYLCFEGAEKIVENYLHPKVADSEVTAEQTGDWQEYENTKIKGAIRTDFILSAEIIVISLGTVATASLLSQFTVLSIIAVAMTVGVYGLVALIVKIDDAGLHLIKHHQPPSLACYFGRFLLGFAPYLMKTLSIVGTLAMFMVGGGILSHGVHAVAETIDSMAQVINGLLVTWLHWLAPAVLNSVFGFIVGLIVVACMMAGLKMKARWFKKI
ncbi:DUF808 domain-containing protein [Pseudoalteromonas ulvae]|uniref:DUF808 domain-containing protein n=1 Tax=Pseudoalteromonas ulvae TaxID=107327 RepID=A0A2C9ZZG5_PSEDV|nr:DUF808 domain-containing protein [Pseudoalteromonas ulvae]OUL56157.1 hypothetical protein B1199_18770 [Pseudoalteromonas ulvae]